MKSKGIPFTVKDIRANSQYLEELIEMGYNSTPVTFIDGTPYLGFRPSELEKLLG